jgi:hypothetical protein
MYCPLHHDTSSKNVSVGRNRDATLKWMAT